MIESLSSELLAHLWQSTLVIGVAGAACSGGAPSSTPGADTSAAAGSGATGGVTLSAPAARRDSAIRVLVYHDMEQVAARALGNMSTVDNLPSR